MNAQKDEISIKNLPNEDTPVRWRVSLGWRTR